MIMKPWFEKFKKDYQGKKVLVMGLGLLGRGVQDAAFFTKIRARVTVTDLRPENQLKSSLEKLKKFPIRYVLGEHRKKDFINTDLVLRNAAVPKNSPFLHLARKHKIPIEMDEALFVKYAPVKIVGVTGTRGKSTTTTLIYQILKKAGFPVWLGGNISGVATLPLLEKVKKGDLVVAELSSWQLQGLDWIKFSPHIGVIVSIYEDHLNRYPSMEAYIADKKVIFKYQKKDDFLVLNRDMPVIAKLAKRVKSQVIWFSKNDFPSDWKLNIRGEHNKTNAAAAIKVAEILKVDQKIIKKVFINFAGLPYRLQTIANIDGVEYVNDTTSTTPAASIVALESFSKPIVLIAGGNSKNLDMSAFAQKIAQKVKKVILLEGTEADNLEKLIRKYKGGGKIIGRFNNLKKAILRTKKLTRPGEVVLFSPGCTSFGMFENEFDRGRQFNKIVLNFKK